MTAETVFTSRLMRLGFSQPLSSSSFETSNLKIVEKITDLWTFKNKIVKCQIERDVSMYVSIFLSGTGKLADMLGGGQRISCALRACTRVKMKNMPDLLDHLDIAIKKFDEFNLPEHWKYVTWPWYWWNALGITFLIALRVIFQNLFKISMFEVLRWIGN